MSVTELIREAYEETGLANASELAGIVFERTPREEMEAYYRKMLPGACLEFFARDRSRVRREASIAERIESGELTVRERKTKADTARTWWESFKAIVINTESGEAPAGKLSGGDWFYAAQNLRTTAKGMTELADKYERIAEVVGDGVTEDADGDVIKKILGA